MDYQPHELCLAFPDMAPEQYRRLADDIKAHGLIHEIVLFEGMILDGRHRYRGCKEAGVTPRFRQFEGTDPVAYVASENAARRHLTESQLALAGAAMKPYEERKARERQIELGRTHGKGDPLVPAGTKGQTARTAEVLAKKVGVGHRTMNRAFKVQEAGSPELNAAVAAGEIKLNQAEKIARLSPAAQKRVVQAPKQQRAAELQEAVNRSHGAKLRNNRPEPIKQAGTPFVRKLLASLERIGVMCADDGCGGPEDTAARFLLEMDFADAGLTAQFNRCEPVLMTLSIIQQKAAKAA